MTVSTSTNSVVYRGNGATTQFAVSFKVLDVDHLQVRRRVFATGVIDYTYVGTDYTYNGIGDDAGTLTLAGTALDDDYELVIERIVPYTQDLDIVNAGGFYPETVEEQLDLMVMGVQQIADLAGRGAVVPVGEDGLELPKASDRAGKFFGFDAAGRFVASAGTGSDSSLRTDLAATTGATLLGYLAAGVGAVARTGQSKLRETVSIMDFGAVGDGVANDTAAFVLALAYVRSLPRGGEIYFPPGIYLMELDARALTSSDKRIRIRGAGRGATQIKPTANSVIQLNLMGCNRFTIQDLTFYSGDVYQAACAIYGARSTLSGDCNGNRFINVECEGNYSGPLVVWSGCESSLFLNCRLAPTATNQTLFWTGHDPANSGVTPPAGTAIAGGTTDNFVSECETYAPFNGTKHFVFSEEAGFIIRNHSFLGGTSNNQRFLTFIPVGNVFTGPVKCRDCHYEAFGTGNIAFFSDLGSSSGDNYFYSIGSSGGRVTADNNFIFHDFDRTAIPTRAPIHIDCEFSFPALHYGFTSGMPLYFNNLFSSRIDWRMRDENGTVVVLGTAHECDRIIAVEPRIITLSKSDAPLMASSVPTSGIFSQSQTLQKIYSGGAAQGDVISNMVTVSGTYGTLTITASATSGTNTATVSSAAALKVGQTLQIAGEAGPKVIASISGLTIKTTANFASTVTTAGTSFYPGGDSSGYFSPTAVLGLIQQVAQVDSTASDVAGLKADFNTLLAALRTSQQKDT